METKIGKYTVEGTPKEISDFIEMENKKEVKTSGCKGLYTVIARVMFFYDKDSDDTTSSSRNDMCNEGDILEFVRDRIDTYNGKPYPVFKNEQGDEVHIDLAYVTQTSIEDLRKRGL
ncbi:hypothetical protein P3U41_05895 [Mammaliicoccus sciuri]|uniref:hypothetical protein n=1 Tax=Mammaliicoccus sciuri TaxID=1296 RepID=UPI002B25A41C|nr:hypothetical protein [Mammaliicoccus sciuri]WQL34302.1 hypothetical protein P3U41_05895 [Mammaliicoccus sciuri]WQL61241.1 hypothetical protein P3T96_05895 [Mammaliicoccus sciuri]